MADVRSSRLDRSLHAWIARIGADPSDPPELALQKRSMVLFTVVNTPLILIWVVAYGLLGLYVAALIPLVYEVVTVTNLAIFARTGRLRYFRLCDHTLSLLLPFALQIGLGGFIPSSGVVLWSFTAVVGAMMFGGLREALRWFIAFVVVVVVAGLIDPLLVNRTDQIPGWVIITFFCLNVLGVTGTSYMLLQYVVRERDAATKALAKEQERSERLLRNVLPGSVADRLKAGETVIADRTPDAGVLFADIAGFTPMSVTLEPDAIIALLDEVFSTFDALTERHELEKIKTIGDAYMVASGLLGSGPQHAERLAQMALDMLEAVRPRAPLALRIGMDIGPVVAGVIGRRRSIYDLWGDTVNTASRMESQGLANAIQVTERAYLRLNGRFVFEERGIVEIKGKGPMRTYLLKGRA